MKKPEVKGKEEKKKEPAKPTDKKKGVIAKSLAGKKDSTKDPVKSEKPKGVKPPDKPRTIGSPAGKKR